MNDKEKREKAIDRVSEKEITPGLERWRRIPGYLSLEVMLEEMEIEQEEKENE